MSNIISPRNMPCIHKCDKLVRECSSNSKWHRAALLRVIRLSTAALAIGWLVLLSGCAAVVRPTANLPLNSDSSLTSGYPQDLARDYTIGVAFSGGGLRASAFAAGVLQGLANTKAGESDLLDALAFMSSVSGGSLTAAYYVLNGRQGLIQIKDEVLMRDFESHMNVSLASPANWARLLQGGLNNRTNFAQVLDDDVFNHARFADLYSRGGPDLWINATDLYHRTSFPFIPGLFNALCSDIRAYPVADAVAASMAVPVVFEPTVLRTFPEGCTSPESAFIQPVLKNASSPRLMRAMAEAMHSYRAPAGPGFVKLVDGGVTDNLGLSSILVSRAVASNAYSPMTARDAVRIKKMLFLVVDAGRGPSGTWNRQLDGPGGIDSAMAATDAAIDAAARLAADSFQLVMQKWRDDLVRHRCSLGKDELVALGGGAPTWRCDDVEFIVELISFQSLTPAMAARVRAIETRLKLPAHEIELAMEAGRQLIAQSAAVRKFAQDASEK
ncbi:patatin-like phospholipase family protein [Pseudoduganella sp. DS3]|uniref:Patatin-like phospholipase family protein n=1 Tax=Pseudoduganella guangdongensis TaxID=2692179 RepID=A0A6N9HCJ6_9BURK|nr:patatin-like phospholipase family protein [Pseudoduganella guangdongensis]MYN01160.1 patatin-like phospholipase family protein [Pseudoduganella guangdongensis]